jgi:hypothetical protein
MQSVAKHLARSSDPFCDWITATGEMLRYALHDGLFALSARHRYCGM